MLKKDKCHSLKNPYMFVFSLCTTLCIEYEPDILAISFVYLSSRLIKFEIADWQDKPPNYTGKWYECFVKDVNIDILKGEYALMQIFVSTCKS